MKKNHRIITEYNFYDSVNDLPNLDQGLLQKAENSANDAYAPYSKFKVGSALLLANQNVVIGSNQENAAYPSGLCAERVAMFSASANNPNARMDTLAVYTASESTIQKQISPCGSCRQVMCEYEVKQNTPIRVLLMNASKQVWEFEACKDLLPLAFDYTALKK